MLRELREEIAVRETRLAFINREIENLRVVIRMVEATAQARAEEAARNAPPVPDTTPTVQLHFPPVRRNVRSAFGRKAPARSGHYLASAGTGAPIRWSNPFQQRHQGVPKHTKTLQKGGTARLVDLGGGPAALSRVVTLSVAVALAKLGENRSYVV